MMNSKFWILFSSAFGTIWAVVFGIAILTQTHIDTGEFGLYGFPLIALVYALYKRDRKIPVEMENDQLRTENVHLKEIVRLLKKEQEG